MAKVLIQFLTTVEVEADTAHDARSHRAAIRNLIELHLKGLEVTVTALTTDKQIGRYFP